MSASENQHISDGTGTQWAMLPPRLRGDSDTGLAPELGPVHVHPHLRGGSPWNRCLGCDRWFMGFAGSCVRLGSVVKNPDGTGAGYLCVECCRKRDEEHRL